MEFSVLSSVISNLFGYFFCQIIDSGGCHLVSYITTLVKSAFEVSLLQKKSGVSGFFSKVQGKVYLGRAFLGLRIISKFPVFRTSVTESRTSLSGISLLHGYARDISMYRPFAILNFTRFHFYYLICILLRKKKGKYKKKTIEIFSDTSLPDFDTKKA